MFEYPNILKNPFDPAYNLEDSEKYSIKETNELIKLEKYSYSLFALWSAVIINLQRRIEFFNIKNFLRVSEEDKEIDYYKEGNTLKERWLKINEYKIISYARKLNLINHISHDLISTLFWMKSNTNEEENQSIIKEEVLALVFLIEKNLFLKPFKEDLRGKNPDILNTKAEHRRKGDRKVEKSQIPNTYHNLLLRSGVKVFEEQNKPLNNEKNIIDEYC